MADQPAGTATREVLDCAETLASQGRGLADLLYIFRPESEHAAAPPLPAEPPDGTVLRSKDGHTEWARHDAWAAGQEGDGECRWYSTHEVGGFAWAAAHREAEPDRPDVGRRLVELPSPDDEATVGHLAAIFSEVVKGHHASDVNLMSSTFTPWSDFARAALSALADQRGQQ